MGSIFDLRFTLVVVVAFLGALAGAMLISSNDMRRTIEAMARNQAKSCSGNLEHTQPKPVVVTCKQAPLPIPKVYVDYGLQREIFDHRGDVPIVFDEVVPVDDGNSVATVGSDEGWAMMGVDGSYEGSFEFNPSVHAFHIPIDTTTEEGFVEIGGPVPIDEEPPERSDISNPKPKPKPKPKITNGLFDGHVRLAMPSAFSNKK